MRKAIDKTIELSEIVDSIYRFCSVKQDHDARLASIVNTCENLEKRFLVAHRKTRKFDMIRYNKWLKGWLREQKN